MPQIGTFSREASGFSGHIRTLTLDIDLVIVAATSATGDKAPDYRIHHTDEDGPEVGVGWKHRSERAGNYVAIVLDDPTFLAPIRANLFRDDDTGRVWSLHWSRPSRRGGKD